MCKQHVRKKEDEIYFKFIPFFRCAKQFLNAKHTNETFFMNI